MGGGRTGSSAPTYDCRKRVRYSLSFRGREAPVGIRSPRPQARNSKASLCEGGGTAKGRDGGRDERGRTPPLRTFRPAAVTDSAMAGRKRCRKKDLNDGQRLYLS